MELPQPKVPPGANVKIVRRKKGERRYYLAQVYDITLTITLRGTDVWLYRVVTQVTHENPKTEIFVIPPEDILEVY